MPAAKRPAKAAWDGAAGAASTPPVGTDGASGAVVPAGGSDAAAVASGSRRARGELLLQALQALSGQHLGRAVEQPLADGGDAAADLCVDLVVEQCAAVVGVLQAERAVAVDEAGGALAVHLQSVAVRRIEIEEFDSTFEHPLHGPDLHLQLAAEPVVADRRHVLAARQGARQNLRVEDGLPDDAARNGQRVRALDLHVSRRGASGAGRRAAV